jgi:hypothetical protein
MSNGNWSERFINGVKNFGIVLKSLAPIGFGILGLITFGYFLFALTNDGALLNNLKQTETARGLITFLVVLTTVSICIILVLFAVASESEANDSFKDRCAFGKEVLTALIGIVGTIVGFYFGSDVSTKKAVKEPVLQVAAPRISEVRPKPGDKIRLISHVSGGAAPYTYDITFTPPDKIEPIKNKDSMDGFIEEEIKIPAMLPPDTELTFKVDVTDKNGEKATLTEKTKKILVQGK